MTDDTNSEQHNDMHSNGTGRFRDARKRAVISDDGQYRYRLWRQWDVTKPTLAFVMLNPSTADASDDDPTIRRCIGYAKDWGYGMLVVGNLYGLRATDPDELWKHPDPVGPENSTHLSEIVTGAEKVIVAWGTNAESGRAASFGRNVGTDLFALDTTKEGHPVHPLYQPSDAKPERWDASTLRMEETHD